MKPVSRDKLDSRLAALESCRSPKTLSAAASRHLEMILATLSPLPTGRKPEACEARSAESRALLAEVVGPPDR